MGHPPLGITARAIVERVIDGDTLDVVLQLPVRVRLLDCWAPETHGISASAGDLSKRALQDLCPHGSRVVVDVPTERATQVSDVLTFGRVLANVFRDGDEVSVSERMVSGNYATRTKTRG